MFSRKYLTAPAPYRPSISQLFGQTFRYAQAALEEIADGKVVKEIEHTIYAKVVDVSELEKASSMEFQEQWELRIPKTDKNAGTGSLRARMTRTPDGDPQYVLTTKIRANKDGDKFELALPSNKENFDQIRFLSEVGMLKERYHFPIEGGDLVWEVDMFRKPDGSFHEWCKIDLEVPSREDKIPDFPIALTDVIMPKGYGRQDDAAADDLVTKIYEECFLTRNQFLTTLEEQSDTEPAASEPAPAEPASEPDSSTPDEPPSEPPAPDADKPPAEPEAGDEPPAG